MGQEVETGDEEEVTYAVLKEMFGVEVSDVTLGTETCAYEGNESAWTCDLYPYSFLVLYPSPSNNFCK